MPSPLTPASAPDPSRAVILGNDALLASLPATPVQLAIACHRSGFGMVVPASWGDELVAAACVRQTAQRGDQSLVFAGCPRVRSRLLARGEELEGFLVALASPPLAAARYLRALQPELTRIEYVGECPGAICTEIDARHEPRDFLQRLREAGIDPVLMPRAFDSIIPPDRRRFWSLPGGFPSPDRLWQVGEWSRIEVEAADSGEPLAAQLAEELLSSTRSLVDLTGGLECACSGVVSGATPLQSRASLAALEPPRSAKPVVDHTVQIPLAPPASEITGTVSSSTPVTPIFVARRTLPGLALVDRSPSPTTMIAVSSSPVPEREPTISEAPPARRVSSQRRRITPVGLTRHTPSSVPVTRQSDGKLVPRAYAARRRPSPSRGRETPPREQGGALGD